MPDDHDLDPAAPASSLKGPALATRTALPRPCQWVARRPPAPVRSGTSRDWIRCSSRRSIPWRSAGAGAPCPFPAPPSRARHLPYLWPLLPCGPQSVARPKTETGTGRRDPTYWTPPCLPRPAVPGVSRGRLKTLAPRPGPVAPRPPPATKSLDP